MNRINKKAIKAGLIIIAIGLAILIGFSIWLGFPCPGFNRWPIGVITYVFGTVIIFVGVGITFACGFEE